MPVIPFPRPEADALIGRVLATDLPSVPDLIRESYSHIPLRKPPEEMDRLIDCAILRDEVGWEPGPPPHLSTTREP